MMRNRKPATSPHRRPCGLLLAGMLALIINGCHDSDSRSAGGAAGRAFGAPDDSQIRPGVAISSRNGSCTANFLFFLNTDTYYLGTAAHCFSPDSGGLIDPCETRNEVHGFDGISIENADHPGVLVYSSWNAMQQNGETAASNVCRFNDFALIRIHRDDLDNIHPSTFLFGGPTALFRGIADVGDDVFTYGRSAFHAGLSDLEGKRGSITAVTGGGWGYRFRIDNPGVPGDSGSPVLHQGGNGLAVLVDVGAEFSTEPVSNGAANLEKALDYGKRTGFINPDVRLATWEEFSP